jgi:hypothetical protein
MEGENAKNNGLKIALACKGMAYEEKSENQASKSPLQLPSNLVHGTIPVLLVGGKPVCESLALLQNTSVVSVDKLSLVSVRQADIIYTI